MVGNPAQTAKLARGRIFRGENMRTVLSVTLVSIFGTSAFAQVPVTVANMPTRTISGVRQLTLPAMSENTSTTSTEPTGSGSGPARTSRAHQFQLSVQLTAAPSFGVAQLQLVFPRAGVIEQISAGCQSSASKELRVTAEVPLPTGFQVFPNDEHNKLAGGFASASMESIAAPNGFSGSFIPPTPVRLLASGTVVIEFFRDLSTASESEFCFVSLVGHFSETT